MHTELNVCSAQIHLNNPNTELGIDYTSVKAFRYRWLRFIYYLHAKLRESICNQGKTYQHNEDPKL